MKEERTDHWLGGAGIRKKPGLRMKGEKGPIFDLVRK